MATSKRSNYLLEVNKPRKMKKSEGADLVIATPNDVLLGRTVNSRNNPGNIRFRSMICSRAQQYLACHDRKEKHRVAEFIFQEISRQGGRFLRNVAPASDCPNTKKDREHLWEIADNSAALNKVKQAFRDNITSDRHRKEADSARGQNGQTDAIARSLMYQSHFKQVRQQLIRQESLELTPSTNTTTSKSAIEIMVTQQQTKSLQHNQLITLLDKQQSILSSQLAANSRDQSHLTLESNTSGVFRPPCDVSMNINGVEVPNSQLGSMLAAASPVVNRESIAESNRGETSRPTSTDLTFTNAFNDIAFRTSPSTYSNEMNFQQGTSWIAPRSDAISHFDARVLPANGNKNFLSPDTSELISFNDDTPLPSQLPLDMQKQLVDWFLPDGSQDSDPNSVGL